MVFVHTLVLEVTLKPEVRTFVPSETNSVRFAGLLRTFAMAPKTSELQTQSVEHYVVKSSFSCRVQKNERIKPHKDSHITKKKLTRTYTQSKKKKKNSQWTHTHAKKTSTLFCTLHFHDFASDHVAVDQTYSDKASHFFLAEAAIVRRHVNLVEQPVDGNFFWCLVDGWFSLGLCGRAVTFWFCDWGGRSPLMLNISHQQGVEVCSINERAACS